MKKIIIATGLFPPDIGGPATYSKMLLEELPKRGIEVSILPFGAVRNLPKVIRHLAYFFQVIRKGRGADIIYAQDPVSVGLPALLASRILRKPFLVRIAGDYAWEQGVQRFGVTLDLDQFVKDKNVSLPVRILRFVQKTVAHGAWRVIVPSQYLKRIVSAWGISPRRIRVIYSVFEGTGVLENKEHLRQKLGLSGTVIVSAGRLVSWKGFTELVPLISRLLARWPELKLFIIGDGPDRQSLEALIAREGLEGQVFLLGRLPRAVLLNYVRAADLFVLNTSYEGFSHQLLEVMSLETPVVTTAVGGNVELIEDGRNGILVEPHDPEALLGAIERVLSDDRLRRAITAGGVSRANDFSQEKMIAELIAELEQL